MVKRFAIVIGAAAAGVMALGAQTAAAVVKHDTKLTITQDNIPPHTLIHGSVKSVKKCERGRRVILFKQRTGTDRKLGTDRSGGGPYFLFRHTWGMRVHRAKSGWHVYAKVRREVRADGDVVCRPDRSQTYRVIDRPDLVFASRQAQGD